MGFLKRIEKNFRREVRDPIVSGAEKIGKEAYRAQKKATKLVKENAPAFIGAITGNPWLAAAYGGIKDKSLKGAVSGYLAGGGAIGGGKLGSALTKGAKAVYAPGISAGDINSIGGFLRGDSNIGQVIRPLAKVGLEMTAPAGIDSVMPYLQAPQPVATTSPVAAPLPVTDMVIPGMPGGAGSELDPSMAEFQPGMIEETEEAAPIVAGVGGEKTKKMVQKSEDSWYDRIQNLLSQLEAKRTRR